MHAIDHTRFLVGSMIHLPRICLIFPPFGWQGNFVGEREFLRFLKDFWTSGCGSTDLRTVSSIHSSLLRRHLVVHVLFAYTKFCPIIERRCLRRRLYTFNGSISLSSIYMKKVKPKMADMQIQLTSTVTARKQLPYYLVKTRVKDIFSDQYQ
jgi:hypothetical protein